MPLLLLLLRRRQLLHNGNTYCDGNGYADAHEHPYKLGNLNLNSYTHAGAHCDFHFYATVNSNINADYPAHNYAHTCADQYSHSDGDCRTNLDADIDTYFNSYACPDIATCTAKADFYTTSHVFSHTYCNNCSFTDRCTVAIFSAHCHGSAEG